MIEFVESPLYNTWFKKHKPQKSLTICTPYIKQHALDQILNLFDLNPLMAGFDFKLIIRGTEDEFTHNRSSDISVLDTFVNISGYELDKIRRIDTLHMKAYLIDDTNLLITSGNLTNSGLFVNGGFGNFEGGIATDDRDVIKNFKNYFDLIWNQSNTLPEFYDEIHSIYNEYIKTSYSDKKVIKRIKRNRYQFSTTKDQTLALSNITFDDLPPVGDFDYVDASIFFIKDASLTYVELGRKLRNCLDLIPLNEDSQKALTNNRKFGEEKGKFLVYLGLATLDRSGSSNKFQISGLGNSYCAMDEDNRKKLIKDQLLSKASIQQLIAYSLDNDQTLNEAIYSLSLASDRTMQRKMGTLNKLLNYIKDLSPEEDLLNLFY